MTNTQSGAAPGLASDDGAAGVVPGEGGSKRCQILDGARHVFLARGFDGASMGEIAKTAGVSKGTLYAYFDSKEALFEALTLEERRSLAEALFQLDADDPDIRAVLRRLGRSFLAMLVRPEHISSVRMVIGAAEKFPRIGQVFYEAGPCRGTSRLAAWLDRQVQAGRLAIEDTGLAAQHFLDLCGSGIMKRLLFAVGGPPSPEALAHHVDQAVRVFFAAYGAKDAEAAATPGSSRPTARRGGAPPSAPPPPS